MRATEIFYLHLPRVVDILPLQAAGSAKGWMRRKHKPWQFENRQVGTPQSTPWLTWVWAAEGGDAMGCAQAENFRPSLSWATTGRNLHALFGYNLSFLMGAASGVCG